MSPTPEPEKYEEVTLRNRSSDYFQETMKLQTRMFEVNSLRNQELLYASVADLKLGLVISHAELSGKVDSLTLGHNRVESTLAEHSNILISIQDNITELRMDLLHGMPSQEPQQQGVNQTQQQIEIVPPPGFSNPVVVPIHSQSSADVAAQPIVDQEGVQTESSSIPETECPSTTDTATTATTATTTIPEVNINPSLTSSSEQGMMNSVTDQVEVTTHQSHSNSESVPSREGNEGQAEIPIMPILPTTSSNSVPVVSTPQSPSSQLRESGNGDIIVDCVFLMDGCCGRELSVPVKYIQARTRGMDSYECHFCKNSYKASYYSQHIKNVCLPKQQCSLCGAPPRVKTSSRKRGRPKW